MNTRFQELHDSIQQVLLQAIKDLPSKEAVQSILKALMERSFTAEQRLDLLCLSTSAEEPPLSFSNLIARYQNSTLSKMFNFVLMDLQDQGLSSEEIFNRVLSPPSLVGKPYSFVLLATKPENEPELGLDYLFMLKELARSPEEALAHLKLPYEYMPGYSWNLYDAVLVSKTTELIYALIDLNVLDIQKYESLKDKKDDMFRLIQDASRCVDEDRLREFKDELEVIIKDEQNPFHQFFSTKRGWSGSGTFNKLGLLLDEVKIRLEGFPLPAKAPSFRDNVAGRMAKFFQPAPQVPIVNFSEDEDKSKNKRLSFHDDL